MDRDPVGTVRTTTRAPGLRTTFDISGRFSTGDVVLSWNGLQTYLAEVRRRLEHLDGRAFGAAGDYFVGIVVNVEDADAARRIWTDQVEPVVFGASHGWVPHQMYEPAVHRRESEAILDLDQTSAESAPGVLVELPPAD